MLGIALPGSAGQEPVQAAAPTQVTAILSAIVAAAILAAAVLAHLGIVGHPDSFIDELSLAAFAVLFGVVPSAFQRAQIQANTAAVLAAHQRLDAMKAPPAADGVEPTLSVPGTTP